MRMSTKLTVRHMKKIIWERGYIQHLSDKQKKKIGEEGYNDNFVLRCSKRGWGINTNVLESPKSFFTKTKLVTKFHLDVV